MVVQIAGFETEPEESYVEVAFIGVFNTNVKNVVFLGREHDAPPDRRSIRAEGVAFTGVLVDDAHGEPDDFRTPDDPFGS